MNECLKEGTCITSQIKMERKLGSRLSMSKTNKISVIYQMLTFLESREFLYIFLYKIMSSDDGHLNFQLTQINYVHFVASNTGNIPARFCRTQVMVSETNSKLYEANWTMMTDLN